MEMGEFMPTFSVSIAHADFIPERKENVAVMLHDLGFPDEFSNVKLVGGKISLQERCEAQWSYGIQSGADFCIMMDDDIRVAPNFWTHVRNAVASKPSEIISFYAITPQARQNAQDGCAWSKSPDALLGTAWCMSRPLLFEFLAWREEYLKPEFRNWAEDAQVCLFAQATGRFIWTTLPSLVETVPHIESTVPAAKRPYARTSVPFFEPKHGWQGEGFGGWAFMEYHWNLITKIRPSKVGVKRFAKKAYGIERAFREYTAKLDRGAYKALADAIEAGDPLRFREQAT